MDDKGQSPLNQFLLNKLKENNPNGQQNTQNCNGLILPILKFQTTGDLDKHATGKFEIPLLRGMQQQNQLSDNAAHLNRILTNLHLSSNCSPAPASAPVLDSSPATNIDLSTALASRLSNGKVTSVNQTKNTGNNISKHSLERDFEIAFIDCEQNEDITKDCARRHHNDADQDYEDLKDLPFISLEAFQAAPSGIGRILNTCSRCYVRPKAIYRTARPAVSTQMGHMRYKIQPFAFNTKSPDDLVLAKLKR